MSAVPTLAERFPVLCARLADAIAANQAQIDRALATEMPVDTEVEFDGCHVTVCHYGGEDDDIEIVNVISGPNDIRGWIKPETLRAFENVVREALRAGNARDRDDRAAADRLDYLEGL